MQDSFSLSPLGLVILGYALGTTITLFVLIGTRPSTSPPAVLVQRDETRGDTLGCAVVVAIAIIALLALTVMGVISL